MSKVNVATFSTVCVLIRVKPLAGVAGVAHFKPVGLTVESAVKICPFVPTPRIPKVLSAVPTRMSAFALIFEMLGVVNTGDVKVLFVRVCAVVKSAVTAVLIATVGTGPVGSVTEMPFPAVTPVMSP